MILCSSFHRLSAMFPICSWKWPFEGYIIWTWNLYRGVHGTLVCYLVSNSPINMTTLLNLIVIVGNLATHRLHIQSHICLCYTNMSILPCLNELWCAVTTQSIQTGQSWQKLKRDLMGRRQSARSNLIVMPRNLIIYQQRWNLLTNYCNRKLLHSSRKS
jgi:hypothetical protein